MRELLDFIISNLIGEGNYEITEAMDGSRTNYLVSAPKEFMGLLIGKGGGTIKALRNLLRVRATLEKVSASLNVAEKSKS